MLIDLDPLINKNCNGYLEIIGNKVQLNDEYYNLMKNYEYVIFGDEFNQPISGIPNNIKIIEITSWEFKQKLDNLPLNLESLSIDMDFYKDDVPVLNLNFLPEGLKHLAICHPNVEAMHLPSSLELLYISNIYSNPEYNINININNLPNKLKHLNIASRLITTDIFNLPETLNTLVINDVHFYNKIGFIDDRITECYPFNINKVNSNLQKIVFNIYGPCWHTDDDTFEKFLENFPHANNNLQIYMNNIKSKSDNSINVNKDIVNNLIGNLIHKFNKKIRIALFKNFYESITVCLGDIFYH